MWLEENATQTLRFATIPFVLERSGAVDDQGGVVLRVDSAGVFEGQGAVARRGAHVVRVRVSGAGHEFVEKVRCPVGALRWFHDVRQLDPARLPAFVDDGPKNWPISRVHVLRPSQASEFHLHVGKCASKLTNNIIVISIEIRMTFC